MAVATEGLILLQISTKLSLSIRNVVTTSKNAKSKIDDKIESFIKFFADLTKFDVKIYVIRFLNVSISVRHIAKKKIPAFHS